jgi:hypothetical protein
MCSLVKACEGHLIVEYAAKVRECVTGTPMLRAFLDEIDVAVPVPCAMGNRISIGDRPTRCDSCR